MRKFWMGCLAVLMADGAGAATLVLHGSNTVGERLAPALVEGWMVTRGCSAPQRSSPGVDHQQLRARCEGEDWQIDIHAYGTGTGFAELNAGRADLWMASRAASASERAQAREGLRLDDPASEHVLALDGLSVIVHPRNTLSSLRLDQVRGIFAGRIRNWRELGGPDAPIRLHARDDRSGTWDSFRSMVLGQDALDPAARRYESSQALSDAVAADPTAMGFVGQAAVGSARALPVADGSAAPVAPASAQVATEDYPLARRLYLYSQPQPSAAAKALLEFSLSDAGQRIVAEIGFVGLSVQPVKLPVAQAEGTAGEDYQAVWQGAERLGLNFRFSERTATLDTRGQRDVQRLVQYMQRPENRQRAVRLAGFADAAELPFAALVLSTDRADYIAALLNRYGVRVSRVRGLGQALPVADNRTDQGRSRNRRVEVWVEGPAG